MTVYLINIALMLIWAYAMFLGRGSTKFKNPKKIFCTAAAIQWILISGLRGLSVGADTISYNTAFENVKTYSWDYIFRLNYDYLFKGLETKDPGYKLLMKIFQIFSGNYQVFLIFIAVVFTVPMAVWIYKYSKDPLLSFLVYSCLFYSFFAITGHRQTIATALVSFIGYEFISRRKLIPFLLCCFAAYMIHKSSLVILPFYFLINKKITRKYIVCIFVATVLTYIFRGKILVFLAESIYTNYADTFGVNMTNGAYTYVAMFILLFIVGVARYKSILPIEENSSYIFNAMFMATVFTPMLLANYAAMRISQYYSVVIMLLLPDIVESFEGKEKTIAKCGVYGMLIILLMRNNPQYVFFWQ